MKRSRQWIVFLVVGLAMLLGAIWAAFGLLAYSTALAPVRTTDAAQFSAPQNITQRPVDQYEPALVDTPTPDTGEAKLGPVPFQAVVQLIMLYEDQGELRPVWVGSGTVISSDGLIVTNAHVALPDTDQVASFLQIAFTREQDRPAIPRFLAEVLQADLELDIAVIRPSTDLDGNPIDRSSLSLPYVNLGDSDMLQLGDPLTILGYPGIGGDTITLTRGDVGGFTHDDRYGDRAFIKTSAAVAGGNSGGLAADSLGNLVAIPSRAGFGASEQEAGIVDCRNLADTNSDGTVDQNDSCVPVGGFINALRPINLAMPLIEAARRGEVAIVEKPKTAQAPSQTSGLLLWDDFTDASYSNSVWSVLAGRWAVDQGVIECSANGKLVAGDFTWGDYAFVVDIYGVDVVDKVVNFRFSDFSHAYGIDFRSDPYNDLVLVKATPSNPNEILRSVHVPNYNNTWYTLSVIAIGNRIVVMVNDRVVLDYVDEDSPILYGKIGLGADLHPSAISAVYFDNALVVAPDH